MSNLVLQHVSTGRRPTTIVALILCACFLALSIMGGAPWWFYPPVIFATLGAAWMVVLNPKSGLTLDKRQLTAFSGNWRHSIELANLASLQIVDWVDGPPSVVAHQMDGSSISIPSACLPKRDALVAAARQCGIILV